MYTLNLLLIWQVHIAILSFLSRTHFQWLTLEMSANLTCHQFFSFLHLLQYNTLWQAYPLEHTQSLMHSHTHTLLLSPTHSCSLMCRHTCTHIHMHYLVHSLILVYFPSLIYIYYTCFSLKNALLYTLAHSLTHTHKSFL